MVLLIYQNPWKIKQYIVYGCKKGRSVKKTSGVISTNGKQEWAESERNLAKIKKGRKDSFKDSSDFLFLKLGFGYTGVHGFVHVV